MDDIVTALRAQQAELATYVRDASVADLLRPSRCDGWTVADVLLHLAQTEELGAASAQGRLAEAAGTSGFGAPAGPDDAGPRSVDEWADRAVAAERGDPLATRDRWLAAADAEADAFAACDPSARVLWVSGELAARSLCTTRLAETWIHTVDVAVAFGPEPAPTDRLWHVARLAWRTLPYALAQEGRTLAGPVAFVLAAPDGGEWTFGAEDDPATTVTGTARDLCTVAGQRAAAADTSLQATGPDADAVLRLVRTFA